MTIVKTSCPSRAGSNYLRATFIEKMCTLVEAEGAIPIFAQTDYKHTQKGLAVDAWSFDPAFSNSPFSWPISRWGRTRDLDPDGGAETFKRLSRFVLACQKGGIRQVPRRIHARHWSRLVDSRKVSKIKQLALVLLTNARVSSRIIKLPQTVRRGFENHPGDLGF